MFKDGATTFFTTTMTSQHESIQTNLNILNGIKHKCDICDGILNSPLQLHEHKKLHRQLQECFDGLGPSPSKLQCSDRDTIKICEDVNQFICWQSNIRSIQMIMNSLVNE